MRILLRSCQKVWRISKADRYFESCSLWAPIFRGPCDQVALLNALDTLVLIGWAASFATS